MNQLATRFVLETLGRSALKEKVLPVWWDWLKQLYRGSLPTCVWFLHSLIDTSWLYLYLFECPHAETRRNFASLIIQAIDAVYVHETDVRFKMEVEQRFTIRVAERMLELLRVAPVR